MAHPAKFTDSILEEAARVLWSRVPSTARILDPFAGTGKGVAFLRERGYTNAIGSDLEPADSWCDTATNRALVISYVDACALPNPDASFEAVFTSPTYGNRFADRDRRPSCAGTYAKGLGRDALEGSSCHLQWGDKYRDLHVKAWAEVLRVLVPGGFFLLNISDHYRAKKLVPVTAWHVSTACALGFEWIDARGIETPRLKRGANGQRAPIEWLHLFRKP